MHISSRKLDGQFVSQERTGNTDLGVISIGVDGKQDRELSLMAKGLKI